MKMSNRFYVVLSLAILVLGMLATSAVNAQLVSGDVTGTILDKSGAVIPNATVEAVNTATGVKTTVQANEVGEYRFNNLPVGIYNISASATNFATTTINGFRVELNKTVTQQITLEVRGTTVSVEVSGALPALDTTTSTLASTFQEKQLADLPSTSSGSGILNLSLMSAGVASSGGMGAGSGPSVGGQRPRNNNFTVEGIDNNDKSVTGPLVPIPNDAVAEFSVLQNQYSPEFGHSSGGQFNYVLKGGTNNFHGVGYVYSNNRNFNAMDQVSKNNGLTSNPRYDNNRFGGNIGGPILKNKLFFFGSAQYTPLGQASQPGTPVCTPTAAGYATLATIPGVSATNLQILQQYATPGDPANPCASTSGAPIVVNGVPVEVATLSVVAPNYSNQSTFLGSIDYNISDKDQLRGRYIYNKLSFIDNAAVLPAFYLPVPVKNQLLTINEYHTFSAHLSNEFRIGFNRSYYNYSAGDFKFPGLDSFPNLTFDDMGGLALGPDGNAPQYTFQNLYQMSENLTWTRGHHALKFGIEGRKAISPQSFTQRARGDYDYQTLALYLTDGVPDSIAERSLGNPVYYGDQVALYWYAKDDWRIRPNLTLNLGVRYEYTTIPFGERSQSLNQAASVPGLVDFSEPRAPKNNWGPRIGLAYTPGSSGNTSIRAGFGISYDVLYDNIGILSLPPQLSGTIDCPGSAACPTSNFLGSGGILPSAGGIQSFDPATPLCAAYGVAGGPDCQRFNTANHIVVNQLSPKSIQWSLGVQHTFFKDYTVEVRYVGTRGIHLNTQERLNAQPMTTSTVFLPTYTTAPSQAALDALPYTAAGIGSGAYGNGDGLVPAYENAGFWGNYLVEFSPNGDSIYHGLATQVTRRMSNGLQFIGSYTWSHTIDNSTADFFSTVLTPRRPQDFQNLKADRANSALDRRHRFTMAVIYDLPYFKNGNWLRKNLMGNWEIAPMYTYQSPEWATVQSASDANGNGDSWSDRAILNPGGVSGTGSGVTALTNSSDEVVAYLATNPNAQYIRGGTFSMPNVGRNTLPMRHINNFDMTVLKRFTLTESTRIEFSVQALNLFNHPQFVPGYLNDVASIGYTSNGARQMLNPGSATFNNPEIVFSSQPRSLQLALKFIF